VPLSRYELAPQSSLRYTHLPNVRTWWLARVRGGGTEWIWENVAAQLRYFDGYNARPISGPKRLTTVAGSSGSDRWSRDASILAAYPVDNFDLRRAVTDHDYRLYGIPSFVELVGAKYRLVPVSGPSCIVPFERCGTTRRLGLFVDAVYAQVTPLVGLWLTVPSGPLPVRRGWKETFATTMISAGEVQVK
jgi:hypothetical protein